MKTFKSYISEASIVRGKYGVGHELQLSKNPKPFISSEFANAKKIELSEPTSDMIEIGSGDEHIIVKVDGKVYKVNGAKTAINNSFNHKSGSGGKGDTHKATRCKEAVSLIMFKYYQENNKPIPEEDIEDLLSNYGADSSLYQPKFYESAILQLSSYKKLKLLRGKKLEFEFQGDTFSKKIYEKAKSIGGGSNSDNWNPADLWIFESSFTRTIDKDILEMSSIHELNFWIRKSFLDGKLCPISLKQASGKSTMELINPLKYKNKKLKYDFTLNSIKIAGSLKSVFIETKSGFTFKANSRGAATNPTLYLEGTMKQENFAMGAIDAKLWKKYHGGNVENGTKIKPSSGKLSNAKHIFNKYSNKIDKRNNEVLWEPNFKKFDKTQQQRYIAAASLLDYVMNNYDDTMRWAFFTAMKVTDTNSMYVKIK